MKQKSSFSSSIDTFDRKILRELQRDNRQSLTAIGQSIGLSEPAVRRRVKALRGSEVIIGDVSLIDPEKMGISVITSISFEKESPKAYDRLKALVHDTPQITQCYTVTGDEDFILIGLFSDMAAYDDWINKYILTDPAIARSRTNVVYKRVKFETAFSV